MTVAQLIAVLQTVPADALVVSTDDGSRDRAVYVTVSADHTLIDISLFAGLPADVTLVREGSLEARDR